MLYMLDTDTVSYALRGQGGAGARILEHKPSEICISVMTLAELRYGASRRKSKRLHDVIDTLIGNVAVMPFDDACATRYGAIASELAERGAPIGEFDVLIAAHALAIEAVLVTNNAKHFGRVKGLKLENWL
jgi:tRNA(fMet)-specific endonuclease VapC